jgi:hypothetical protein
MVIDASKVTADSFKLKVESFTENIATPPEYEFKVSKMTKWNDKASVSNFEINEVCTYGGYWIDVPLGEENISGNAVSVDITSADRTKEQLDVKMTHLRNFDMKFINGVG